MIFLIIFQIVWLLGWVVSMISLYKPLVWDRHPHKLNALMTTPLWAIQMLLGWWIILPMHLFGKQPDKTK